MATSDHSGPGPARTQVYAQSAVHSAPVIGVYVGLVLAMLFVYYRGYSGLISDLLAPFLALVLLVYLARYSSTRYRIDGVRLYAWRLFGSRRMRLDRIRKIQPANLRDLGAVGFLGTWGWRGRVWSTLVGAYDTVHTESRGLLITGSGVPLFISPRDPEEFQRELSRRVRSANGGVAPDEGPV